MCNDETRFRFSSLLSLDQPGCQENQAPTPARGKGLPLWKQTDCVWGVRLSQWKTLLITSRNWLYLPDQQQRMPLKTLTHTRTWRGSAPLEESNRNWKWILAKYFQRDVRSFHKQRQNQKLSRWSPEYNTTFFSLDLIYFCSHFNQDVLWALYHVYFT